MALELKKLGARTMVTFLLFILYGLDVLCYLFPQFRYFTLVPFQQILQGVFAAGQVFLMFPTKGVKGFQVPLCFVATLLEPVNLLDLLLGQSQNRLFQLVKDLLIGLVFVQLVIVLPNPHQHVGIIRGFGLPTRGRCVVVDSI